MSRTEEDNNEANTLLAGGAAITAIGIAGVLVGGALCPVCVVAAPALLGFGIARKVRARRAKCAPASEATPRSKATTAALW